MNDKDLFKGTAEYYHEFRPEVPSVVVDYIRRRFHLDGKGALLDLGCGTGQSTFAFTHLFEKCVGVDPDEDMLKIAKSNTPFNQQIDWIVGTDKIIFDYTTPFRLVIASRAFHWMNQYPLLEKAKDVIDANGGFAIIGDGSFWTGKEPWQQRIKEVIQEFLGQDRRAGNNKYSASVEPYAYMLAKSGYHNVEYAVFQIKRFWSIEQIIGCLYSTSFAAPRLFGEKRVEFENRLKAELLVANNGNQVFEESAEFIVQSGFVSPQNEPV